MTPEFSDTMGVSDGGVITVSTTGEPDRKDYLVTAKAGLFKNGKHYKTGSKVSLDARTAASFKEAGDVQ